MPRGAPVAEDSGGSQGLDDPQGFALRGLGVEEDGGEAGPAHGEERGEHPRAVRRGEADGGVWRERRQPGEGLAGGAGEGLDVPDGGAALRRGHQGRQGGAPGQETEGMEDGVRGHCRSGSGAWNRSAPPNC
jgi:hypothetical protein